jgi:hypothetical protein
MPTTQLRLTGQSLAEPLDFSRAGMPAEDSIHAVTSFTPVPGGPRYQILHSTEFDAYESSEATTAVAQLVRQGPPAPAAISEALRALRKPVSENFAGTDREAAKLSIGSGHVEQFADVKALIATLPSEAAMVKHVPPISTGSTSARVTEEQRNVHVVGFLYAASREADNDFHLIVGRDPTTLPETYMTMEVSGLPPASNTAFQALSAARRSFETFFGAHLPQLAYDYYHPPIPVTVQGSLFFDMTHATGQAPGPPSLKSRMPVIWEVHPVTTITLGRHGLPAAASVASAETFVSPQGNAYNVLHTTETDAYDPPPPGSR